MARGEAKSFLHRMQSCTLLGTGVSIRKAIQAYELVMTSQRPDTLANFRQRLRAIRRARGAFSLKWLETGTEMAEEPPTTTPSARTGSINEEIAEPGSDGRSVLLDRCCSSHDTTQTFHCFAMEDRDDRERLGVLSSDITLSRSSMGHEPAHDSYEIFLVPCIKLLMDKAQPSQF